MGRAAQRHAPCGRRRGVDAPARGRTCSRLGRSVGGDSRDVRLHESHAAPRGAGEVDGRSLRLAASAASRDRLRDQSSLPRGSARRFSRRRRATLAALAHRRKRATLRAHGAPRVRRQPHDQRRRAAPLRVAEADRAARFRRSVAGKILQRDQRRHAAPVRRREQSQSHGTRHQRGSATAGCKTSTRCAHSRRSRTTRNFSSSGAR